MNNGKEIKDYLNLYLPFKVEHLGVMQKVIGIVPQDQGFATFYTRYGFFTRLYNEIKLPLRRLRDMTDEERKELNVRNPSTLQFYTANQFKWLLSKHFDLFGLIPAGLAIDINEINKPAHERAL